MNPVLQALSAARTAEVEREHQIVAQIVAKELSVTPAPLDRSRWPLFQAWCRNRQVDAFPTRPHALACYILENASIGIGELERVVESVSAVHEHTSDPTLSPLVTAALARVSPIEPPRSWDRAHAAMFMRLPRELKQYVHQREQDRDRAVRVAQNNRKKDSQNGIHQNASPAAGNVDAPRAD
jgi:hypothetical protein